ncbi:Trs120-domain-containing protein [Annulohypoxylon maeteangense]|uniref:Trs120-domain-containing protein n=1 Tax=Annulohypoxylon maeteangense TaxID=1927788 RepID=UPI0020082FDA|nr:Trs120-domain-containing protein [Annulohypoxylon maeteangense]KAI0884442.1 Trs120-domain-containing protein [Annulohypoxylon maeteangense]
MSLDSMLPVAPARVRALVLPVGQITRDRFSSFVQRLNEEHVVYLRDITPDGRPNRNMFSPLAFPNGAMFYDLITYVPPPSHLALTPFELFREPLALIAIADGKELENVAFSKRQSANGYAPTMAERNIRTLYQELENLRDAYPKILAHEVLIFDYAPHIDNTIPMPEGIKTIPSVEKSKRTTIKTIMCDISSLLLAEMTTLAKSLEGKTTIDSPGQAPARSGLNGNSSWTSDDANPAARRNSQHAIPSITRSASSSSAADRNQARMSMPVPFKSLPFGSNSSTPSARPTTPVHRSGLSNPPTTFDDIASANGSSSDVTSPDPKSRPDSAGGMKPTNQDKVSVQGFGPGGLNERFRNKGRGRATILVGSLYLQAGRWTDALKELVDGATVAKSINDHLWHGKALELITICLLLLGWIGVQFQVPSICLPTNDKSISSISKGPDSEEGDPNQPKHLWNLQTILPELLERIVGLYSRISGEQLPPLPLSESIIRFCTLLTGIHICDGKLDKEFLDGIVLGKLPTKPLNTSPRLTINPSRAQITTLLFKAFPSSTSELLATVDRAIILSGIASVLGSLGFHRKKAMVVRELVSVLIGGLVEARTRGAAEVGIHPAAGLVALNAINGHGNGALALELGEGDIEHGIDAFLGLLCKTYGVVDFDDATRGPSDESRRINDTDEKVISRIRSQALTRQFGMNNVKLNILRACINFSEALPDFNGVLKFSSDLLRTAGSGVAPGPRREDAAPIITREEQIRLATNITKTSGLSQRLGLGHLSAEYWDEFLVRGITMDPLPPTKTPTSHPKTVLPGVTTARTSQDVNPFIYNPFIRASDKAAVEMTLVAGETATFRITLQNPYEIDVDIESIKLDTEGTGFESSITSTIIGPYRTQILKLTGTPTAAGHLKITGAIVKVRGCRERRFPIFPQAWAADTETKIKGIGLVALEKNKQLPFPGPSLKPDSIGLSVISAQPVVVIKSTTLFQSSVMILEGERQVFSVTLQNLSSTTPADLLLFSFQDSTQGPLQTALTSRDATPAELYEYELILARKQAFRLRKIDDSKRYIAPGGTATFDFEILGKPGLTNGTIQVDYAHLGVPQTEISNQFHTRQVCLDLTITVNASVELARMDVLPIKGEVPKPIWTRLGAEEPETESEFSDEEHCLLLIDLRNAWPSDMQVCLKAGNGIVIQEHILPGNTNRVVVPVPRVYIDDPHASIPALNPSRQRQFVVSSSKITPDIERGNREAFWYREKILEKLSGSWKTLSGPSRQGTIELRGLRLAPRMIEAIKIDEVGIDISIEDPDTRSQDEDDEEESESNAAVYTDEFAQISVVVTNRTDEPIFPTLRLMPVLCHRPPNVALDFTRKFAWIGTLQQSLPRIEAKSEAKVLLSAMALCRGEFEISASVEETKLWKAPPPDKDGDAGKSKGGKQGRERSETEIMMDAVLGAKERRIWHSRRPCRVSVRDR